MSGEYKATCGCEIHVAQWTSKRKVVTQKSCPLHLAAPDLLAACKLVLPEIEQNWRTSDSEELAALKSAIAKAQGE
jgi:hypothetical protein